MDLEQIIELENRRLAALVRSDIATLDALLHPDLTYVHTNGIQDTKASLLESLEKGVRKYVSFQPTIRTKNNFDPLFVLSGTSQIEYEARGSRVQAEIAYTAVWLKCAEGARLIAWQSSPATFGK